MSETTSSPGSTVDTDEAMRLLAEEGQYPEVEGTRPGELSNLAAMLDVPLRITVELGRAQLPLAEVLAFKPGVVVELDRFPGEPLDLYANGRLIARGEIIVLNDIFGFRITDILISSNERS